MSGIWILFFVVLVVLAAVFRADYVLILLYLLAGVYVISQWWGRRAVQSLVLKRDLTERAFFGEKVNVHVEARNQGLLPVVWVHLRETLPLELAPEGTSQQVVSIGPKEKVKFEYTLDCSKRGYYPIGPMKMFSGDLLGLSKQILVQVSAVHLTVFPKIIPLSRVSLPTHSPLGTLRSHQPLSADPAKVRGKRDYLPGDSLRLVDWKTSAAARRLQVKLLEPSISLETMLFLNLNRGEFAIKDLHRASELGIIVAASLANWIICARQAVGLCTNGIDALSGNSSPLTLLPRTGQGHLIQLLETLARAQIEETYSLVNLIQQEIVHLSWGTTMIVIANQAEDDLFETLFQCRRRGIDPLLIVCGYVEDIVKIQRKANYFRYPLFHFMSERDLDIWRG